MTEPPDDTTEDLDHTEPSREARSVFALRWFGREGDLYTLLQKNRVVLGRGDSADAVLVASGVSRDRLLGKMGP